MGDRDQIGEKQPSLKDILELLLTEFLDAGIPLLQHTSCNTSLPLSFYITLGFCQNLLGQPAGSFYEFIIVILIFL